MQIDEFAGNAVEHLLPENVPIRITDHPVRPNFRYVVHGNSAAENAHFLPFSEPSEQRFADPIVGQEK